MNQRKAIFFDFDGVIADSLSIAFEVNKMTRPTLTLERYKSYFNGNINEIKYEDESIREVDFFKEYGKRFETLSIDEQKKNVIQKLAKEFQLFIISSTTTSIIRSYLQRHKILSYFTEILGNEISPSKTKKFEMLFEKYNLTPNNIIFITDSSGDMKEARKVGIKAIVGILGGFQSKADLKHGNPTVIVKDFFQFNDFCQKYL